MRPTECKWCGCGDIERESPIMQSVIVTFACGTMSDTDADGTRWLRDQRCAGPVGKLYRRIKRAVEVLEGAERFDVIPWDGGVIRDPSDGGGEVDADVVDQVIEMLKGETNGKTD